MKSTFTFFLSFILNLSLFATVRTVNNNSNLPGNPGQYTTIQAAITASSSGDTILIAGSPTPYAPFNPISLQKRLDQAIPGLC